MEKLQKQKEKKNKKTQLVRYWQPVERKTPCFKYYKTTRPADLLSTDLTLTSSLSSLKHNYNVAGVFACF